MFTVFADTYIVKRDSQGKPIVVCLGLKKTNPGIGRWNGFGGKVEKGETIEQAAIREVFEECNLKIEIKNLHKKAELKYFQPSGDCIMHVFLCDKWKGEAKESEEMKPKWFTLKNLPYKNMWENDSIWLSKFLTTNKIIKGTFWIDKQDKTIKYQLREIK